MSKRALIAEKQRYAEEVKKTGDLQMGIAFAGSQIGRQKTAWDHAKAGYLEMGGKEETWKKEHAKPKFLKELKAMIPGVGGKGSWSRLGKSIFGMPTGEATIGDKTYDLKNIGKIGKFKESIGADLSAFTKDSSFKDILDQYKSITAPGGYEKEKAGWFKW